MCSRAMRDRLRGWALAAALVAIVGCTEGPPPNPYPEELVTNFMTGCRRRASRSICECALGRIQRRWTADEFQRLDQTLGDEGAAQIAETVAACAGR
jgi:hypothetical protein